MTPAAMIDSINCLSVYLFRFPGQDRERHVTRSVRQAVHDSRSAQVVEEEDPRDEEHAAPDLQRVREYSQLDYCSSPNISRPFTT